LPSAKGLGLISGSEEGETVNGGGKARRRHSEAVRTAIHEKLVTKRAREN